MGEPQKGAEGKHVHRRPAFILSIIMHLIVLILIVWPFAQVLLETQSGGTGWQDDIAITASDTSSSGYIGMGDDPKNRPEAPERGPSVLAHEVTIVRPDQLIPPVPEIRLSSDAAERLLPPDRPREKPEEAVEEKERPVTPTGKGEASRTAAENRGQEVSEGGGGSQNAPLGSIFGEGPDGAGAGSSDRRGRGDFMRGDELKAAFAGFTIVGKEGFWDGSTSDNASTRTEYSWAAYYAPDGSVEARFTRPGARVPHGTIEVLDYAEEGRWRIEGDLFCHAIDKVGSGVPVCFEVHRKGDEIAMYYAKCGALTRCWRGRLGPKGVLIPGRAFTN